jgi:hypothetical protein
MTCRVANERGHRFDAMFVENAMQKFFAFREGFVPRNFAPCLALADHGDANAVGVFVQSTKRCALWANEALRPDIVTVGTDYLHMVVVIKMDFEAAHALTERALAQKDPGAIGIGPVLATNDLLACCRCGDGNFHGATPRCVGTGRA